MVMILGIDPGLSGGLCLYDGSPTPYVIPMPILETKKGNEVDWDYLSDQFDLVLKVAAHAYVEDVHSMPKEGVSSAFKFGGAVIGVWAMCAAFKIPRTRVSPGVWQPPMIGLGGKKSVTTKDKSVARALELFPSMRNSFVGPRGGKIDGNADAAMIAVYGYHIHTGRRFK